jgi:pimeloyl-ACP methyl ester carboxylesterase
VNRFTVRSRRVWYGVAGVLVLLGLAVAAFLARNGFFSHPENQRPGKFPERIVYSRSRDDVVNAGILFASPKESPKSVAIIWIHGWGVNFYQPTYVGIGRALAEHGYTCISGNTRMHDLGNVMAWRNGKRIRGGGYWGVASEEVRDVAAWIDFAQKSGFKKVVLVGHSAGWAAVRNYVTEEQDGRVAGVVIASGTVRPPKGPPDSDQLAEARRLMEKGEGDALIRDPKRSFPSYISAATFLDIAKDLESKTSDRWMKEIRCPVLAFYSTLSDVGGKKDLEFVKSSLAGEPSLPVRVDTLMIERTDHMYMGEEAQVAKAIANWADTLTQNSLKE